MCFPKYRKIKDLSYFESPVQAARYLHQLKNYDRDIGKFIYNDDIYILHNTHYILIK